MNLELSRLLGAHSLPEGAKGRILEFYEILVQENKLQNLTRLIEPEQFYFGHFLDVWELLKSNLLTFPALDLGSGAGVPGLLAGLISGTEWILTDSEQSKADYLQRTVQTLGLEAQMTIAQGRAEDYLKRKRVATVIARAVGPVERVYAWIAESSNWDHLVLLKGPGWAEEWEKFQISRFRGRLSIVNEHHYEIGPERKKRVIVQLGISVPRRTAIGHPKPGPTSMGPLKSHSKIKNQ